MRYHFHIGDNPDLDGTELDSVGLAKCEAVRMAGRMLCDSASEFWDSPGFMMVVTNERGLVLFTLDFVGTDAPCIQAVHPIPGQPI
jgi:hypothetical protein